MKFNDVFKANNYAGRKKILDRFPLSKEDKDDVNKSIEKLSNSSEGGGADGAFTYKSRKVVWKVVDSIKIENASVLLSIYAMYFPIYSFIERYYDANTKHEKHYGYKASIQIVSVLKDNITGVGLIEESEGYGIYRVDTAELDTNKGIIGIVQYLNFVESGISMNEDEAKIFIKDTFGIEQISYEEYINFKVNFDNKFANF